MLIKFKSFDTALQTFTQTSNFWVSISSNGAWQSFCPAGESLAQPINQHHIIVGYPSPCVRCGLIEAKHIKFVTFAEVGHVVEGSGYNLHNLHGLCNILWSSFATGAGRADSGTGTGTGTGSQYGVFISQAE